MNADLLVGPVTQRTPADKVRILHCFESILNMVLPPIGAHDVLIAPGFLVREENVFYQQCMLKTTPCRLIDTTVEARTAILFGHVDVDEISQVTSGYELNGPHL